MTTPALMTVAEIAQQTGFSTKTVLRALNAGELAGSKVRSRWVVWPDDFRAWIDAGRRGRASDAAPPLTGGGTVGSAERLRAIERAA